MSSSESMLSREECTQEVRLMARRTALLFSAFAGTLVEELGEEQASRLISRAVWSYGQTCGQAVRDEVLEHGLPLTQENYGKVRDLPRLGWEGSSLTTPEGEVHPLIHYCPLAETFKALGPQAQRFGRIYCQVDQAKQQAYNPEIECVHVKNVLDGDSYCEFAYIPAKSVK